MATTTDVLVTQMILDAKGYKAGAQQVTAATKQATQDINGLKGALGAAAGSSDGFTDSLKLATAELDSSTPIVSEVVSILKVAAVVAIGAAAAMMGLGFAAMRVAADYEALVMALRIYMGTAEATAEEIRRLKEIAMVPGLGFKEAIEGSVRLQAAGMSARLAERALLGFGNALASAGGGKAELDYVMLALQQIASMGKVGGQEIRQLMQHIPQIRQIMLQAFGTADTEQLTKLGIGSQKFIMMIIDELEKLPRAQNTAKNSFENFSDAIYRGTVEIGLSLNSLVMPALDKLSSFLTFISSRNVFTQVLQGWYEALQGLASETTAWLRQLGELRSEWSGLFQFMGGSTDFGDFLVRGAAVFISVMDALPDIVKRAVDLIIAGAEYMRSFVNNLIDAINTIFDIISNGIKIKGPLGMDFDIAGQGSFSKIGHIPDMSAAIGDMMGGMGAQITGGAQYWYDQFKNWK